jgi:hypothetical protein
MINLKGKFMSLSPRIQFIIGIVLATLLVLTRSQHFANLHHLPGASWAVFFLAGVYIKSRWGFSALLGIALLVDLSALWTGLYSSCFTPAYLMLLPAYASLWLAGRWYAKQHDFTLNSLLLLCAAILIGTFSCELLSSGGYYLFSGKFEPSLSEFASRLVQYYPYSIGSTTFYVTIAALLHSIIGAIQRHNGLELKAWSAR